MATLTKEQILGAKELPPERVAVPEWGGEVCVRVMSGAERDQFEAVFANGVQPQAMANIRAKLAALTLCDEDGKRLFTDAEVVELGRKSGAALDRVFDAARRVNRMSDKDVEELVGNSAGVRGGASGSTSPVTSA